MDIEKVRDWHVKLSKIDDRFMDQTKLLAKARHQTVGGMVQSLIEKEIREANDVGKVRH